jgi:hypothetical protein
MTKGQRAMIAAKVRLLNRQSTRAVAGSTSVSSQYVGFASIVLQYAPDLVGTSPLSRRRALTLAAWRMTGRPGRQPSPARRPPLLGKSPLHCLHQKEGTRLLGR